MKVKLSEQFEATHGVNATMDPQIMMHVAQALLVVMGADGEVSPREWAAFEGRARTYGYPEEAIQALKAFDFKTAKLEDYVPSITTWGFQRNVLHDAIVFARADGEYHVKERAAVAHLAKLLGIEPYVVEAIEGIVEAEEGLQKARIAILQPGR